MYFFLSFSFAPSPLLDATLPCWESFLPVLQPAPSQVHQLVGKHKTWQIVLEMYIYIYHKRQHPVLPSSGLFQIQLRIWRWGTPIVLTCVGRTSDLSRMFDAKKQTVQRKKQNLCIFLQLTSHSVTTSLYGGGGSSQPTWRLWLLRWWLCSLWLWLWSCC